MGGFESARARAVEWGAAGTRLAERLGVGGSVAAFVTPPLLALLAGPLLFSLLVDFPRDPSPPLGSTIPWLAILGGATLFPALLALGVFGLTGRAGSVPRFATASLALLLPFTVGTAFEGLGGGIVLLLLNAPFVLAAAPLLFPSRRGGIVFVVLGALAIAYAVASALVLTSWHVAPDGGPYPAPGGEAARATERTIAYPLFLLLHLAGAFGGALLLAGGLAQRSSAARLALKNAGRVSVDDYYVRGLVDADERNAWRAAVGEVDRQREGLRQDFWRLEALRRNGTVLLTFGIAGLIAVLLAGAVSLFALADCADTTGCWSRLPSWIGARLPHALSYGFGLMVSLLPIGAIAFAHADAHWAALEAKAAEAERHLDRLHDELVERARARSLAALTPRP